jgi:cysteinyl-tRNA synthetase
MIREVRSRVSQSNAIKIYNTLTRQKEVFEPIQPGKVGIYLCGPTVYSKSHIGHMVGPVIFDTVKRYLAFNGFKVTFVVNITDIDDKIINQAKVENCSIEDLSRRITADYQKHLASLGVEVDHFPHATQYIQAMQKMIATLIEKGHAYPAQGDVYFDVTSFHEYGKLSNRRIDELLAGARKEVSDIKKSAADFALWKRAKPGEPAWESPWGPGRPGWHIECSVMSSELLGETFDIHGGGLDLVFPHHEDEIAQSECCSGQPYAKYWMHNGLMQYSNETRKIGARAGDFASQEEAKMSKSKGNVRTLDDLFAKYPPPLVRYFLLATHYRSPINFGDEPLDEVGTGYHRLVTFAELYGRVMGEDFFSLPKARSRSASTAAPSQDSLLSEVVQHRERFLEYMDDDFNTGGGVAVIGELVKLLNRFAADAKLEESSASGADKARFKQGAGVLRELTSLLGILLDPPTKAAANDDGTLAKVMDLMIALRQEARQRKDFALSDRIRDGLAAIGVTLQDGREGTRWKVDSP